LAYADDGGGGGRGGLGWCRGRVPDHHSSEFGWEREFLERYGMRQFMD
jgi:hypothetical protein